jgi:apolipoprotein N-acyltransferase
VKILKPVLLPALSGIFIALSFPKPGLNFLAWIALVPLFFALKSASPKAALSRGLLAGFVGSVLMIYWMFLTVYWGTHQWLLAALCLVLLASYMAVYVAFWAFLSRFVRDDSGWFPLYGAVLWVAMEYARSFMLSGFTWGFLGYAQYKFLPLVQIAEYTGVYGVSFLLVLVNGAIYQSIRYRKMLPLAVTAVLMIAVLGQGQHLYQENRAPQGQSIKVAVLQGNIDQYKKWDAAFRDEIMTAYAGLARSAAKEGAQVIAWPETALPGCVPADVDVCQWLTGLVRETGAWHIVGALCTADYKNMYNGSVLFSPQGSEAAEHHKNRLVIFGEYIPCRALLGSVFKALNAMGEVTPGEQPSVLRAVGTGWGPNICSENFFGDFTRLSVLRGAGVLVNQTNDGWYGKTSQPEQHFSMNIFRAVEGRRTVVVAANTGVSAVVSPAGEISHRLPLFKPGYFVAEVTPSEKLTLYTRLGDVFAWLCALLALGIPVFVRVQITRPSTVASPEPKEM